MYEKKKAVEGKVDVQQESAVSKKLNEWKVVEVATQTDTIIVNEDGTVQLDIKLALAKVLNLMEKIDLKL